MARAKRKAGPDDRKQGEGQPARPGNERAAKGNPLLWQLEHQRRHAFAKAESDKNDRRADGHGPKLATPIRNIAETSAIAIAVERMQGRPLMDAHGDKGQKSAADNLPRDQERPDLGGAESDLVREQELQAQGGCDNQSDEEGYDPKAKGEAEGVLPAGDPILHGSDGRIERRVDQGAKQADPKGVDKDVDDIDHVGFGFRSADSLARALPAREPGGSTIFVDKQRRSIV